MNNLTETKYHHYACLECGEIYYSTDPQITLYCSKKCEQAARKNKDFMGADYIVRDPYDLDGVESHVCVQCGERFITNLNTKKYFCSRFCANKYADEHKIGEKHVCAFCGREYYRPGKPGNIDYCNSICKQKATYRAKAAQRFATYVKEHGRIRTCAECGKEFAIRELADLRRKYCGRECQQKAGQRKHRQRSKQKELQALKDIRADYVQRTGK